MSVHGTDLVARADGHFFVVSDLDGVLEFDQSGSYVGVFVPCNSIIADTRPFAILFGAGLA